MLTALRYGSVVPMLSCPNAAFLLWLPGQFGNKRTSGFGLGQLSFALELGTGIEAFGSTFSTTGILVSEFARKIPLSRRSAIDMMRGLLSSCVVGNIFLPGDLTRAEVKLSSGGSLVVSGGYKESVNSLMYEAKKNLSSTYLKLGSVLLPGSFTVGPPGGDIHYAGTLPMSIRPVLGQTSQHGEVEGLKGVYVVDGACLPTLPAKSHTLTIMANADRIGAFLASKNS